MKWNIRTKTRRRTGKLRLAEQSESCETRTLLSAVEITTADPSVPATADESELRDLPVCEFVDSAWSPGDRTDAEFTKPDSEGPSDSECPPEWMSFSFMTEGPDGGFPAELPIEEVLAEESVSPEDWDPAWAFRSLISLAAFDGEVSEPGLEGPVEGEFVESDEVEVSVGGETEYFDVTTLEGWDPSWAFRNFVAGGDPVEPGEFVNEDVLMAAAGSNSESEPIVEHTPDEMELIRSLQEPAIDLIREHDPGDGVDGVDGEFVMDAFDPLPLGENPEMSEASDRGETAATDGEQQDDDANVVNERILEAFAEPEIQIEIVLPGADVHETDFQVQPSVQVLGIPSGSSADSLFFEHGKDSSNAPNQSLKALQLMSSEIQDRHVTGKTPAAAEGRAVPASRLRNHSTGGTRVAPSLSETETSLSPLDGVGANHRVSDAGSSLDLPLVE
jgi:hypothetical protein